MSPADATAEDIRVARSVAAAYLDSAAYWWKSASGAWTLASLKRDAARAGECYAKALAALNEVGQ